MSFVPSCDHREDAIKSLSEIYAVPTEKILGALRAPEVLQIAEVYSEIGSPGFHFVVCHVLEASPRSRVTRTAVRIAPPRVMLKISGPRFPVWLACAYLLRAGYKRCSSS